MKLVQRACPYAKVLPESCEPQGGVVQGRLEVGGGNSVSEHSSPAGDIMCKVVKCRNVSLGRRCWNGVVKKVNNEVEAIRRLPQRQWRN